MATTNSNFALLSAALEEAGGWQLSGALLAVEPAQGARYVASSSATLLDKVAVDLSTAGYAANGAAQVTTSGTTPVTFDLTNIATNATAHAGDTAFGTVNQLVFRNLGAADMTIAPGGSNPFSLGLTGTSPTLSIPAGSTVTIQWAAGKTVDSTHKTFAVTPTSGGSFAFAVGGA